jgi:hypothetical protein
LVKIATVESSRIGLEFVQSIGLLYNMGFGLRCIECFVLAIIFSKTVLKRTFRLLPLE